MTTLCLFPVKARAHLAKVPEAEDLVLAVRDDVATVAFSGDVRDTFCVPDEHTRRFGRGA